jgi:hypothetical protein
VRHNLDERPRSLAQREPEEPGPEGPVGTLTQFTLHFFDIVQGYKPVNYAKASHWPVEQAVQSQHKGKLKNYAKGKIKVHKIPPPSLGAIAICNRVYPLYRQCEQKDIQSFEPHSSFM